MNIEKLNKGDWEYLSKNKDVMMSFGIETENGELLSKVAYGGKCIHTPAIVNSKSETKPKTVYVLFGDVPEEPMVVFKED